MSTLHEKIDNLPVSQDTKYVLQELIKRKGKVDTLKFLRATLSILNLAIGFAVIYWLLKMGSAANTNVFNFMSYLAGNQAAVLFIALSVSSFILAGWISKEYYKEKDKYDGLRKETVKWMAVNWQINNESILRDQVSELLDEIGDVNIRYWNK